ncbi:hypothetical protein C2R22_10740 [Salinigranum rubrum]|uniref:Uncharacterized protein n=1 Tax=Salinigranum rubrum TaxID=755307 RepID=A0A2I8VJG6_9EURY|nr:hypothetical protein [Salinigranum rubrum]AUV82066.1 hypothetical protein C2R22_10740 [Salinigranum rubrum]
MSAGQRIAAVLEDNRLTRDELDTYDAVTVATALERLGVVRDAQASAFGNNDFFEADGLGRVKDTNRQQFREKWRGLFESVVFPLVEGDKIASSGLVTEEDRNRVRFGESDSADVVNDVQQHNESVTAENNAVTSSSGVSTGLLAVLAGAVALAFAVLGGQ